MTIGVEVKRLVVNIQVQLKKIKSQRHTTKGRHITTGFTISHNVDFKVHVNKIYTDKKENQLFLIYKEIHVEWSSCKVIYD
jgi:hypothetical protein